MALCNVEQLYSICPVQADTSLLFFISSSSFADFFDDNVAAHGVQTKNRLRM